MGDRGPAGGAAAAVFPGRGQRPRPGKTSPPAGRRPAGGQARAARRRPPAVPRSPVKNPLTQKITGQGAFCWESQLWLYRFQIGVGVDEQPLRG